MSRRLAAWVLVVGMAGVVTAAGAGSWKPTISVGELPKLLSNETAVIQKSVTGGLGDKKNATRARVSALMIAGYAQSAMLGDKAKSAQLAGLRDHAIALAQAIKSGKDGDVKSMLEQVKPDYAGKPGTKTDAVDLSQYLDLDDLMTQFKPERSGGKGLEKVLTTYAGKRAPLSADDMKGVVLLANQCAVIAQFTHAFAPAADEGKKKKADWLKWSVEMEETAVASANAASASRPNDKAVKAALKKLEDSCVKCHAVFRDSN